MGRRRTRACAFSQGQVLGKCLLPVYLGRHLQAVWAGAAQSSGRWSYANHLSKWAAGARRLSALAFLLRPHSEGRKKCKHQAPGSPKSLCENKPSTPPTARPLRPLLSGSKPDPSTRPHHPGGGPWGPLPLPLHGPPELEHRPRLPRQGEGGNPGAQKVPLSQQRPGQTVGVGCGAGVGGCTLRSPAVRKAPAPLPGRSGSRACPCTPRPAGTPPGAAGEREFPAHRSTHSRTAAAPSAPLWATLRACVLEPQAAPTGARRPAAPGRTAPPPTPTGPATGAPGGRLHRCGARSRAGRAGRRRGRPEQHFGAQESPSARSRGHRSASGPPPGRCRLPAPPLSASRPSAPRRPPPRPAPSGRPSPRLSEGPGCAAAPAAGATGGSRGSGRRLRAQMDGERRHRHGPPGTDPRPPGGRGGGVLGQPTAGKVPGSPRRVSGRTGTGRRGPGSVPPGAGASGSAAPPARAAGSGPPTAAAAAEREPGRRRPSVLPARGPRWSPGRGGAGRAAGHGPWVSAPPTRTGPRRDQGCGSGAATGRPCGRSASPPRPQMHSHPGAPCGPGSGSSARPPPARPAGSRSIATPRAPAQAALQVCRGFLGGPTRPPTCLQTKCEGGFRPSPGPSPTSRARAGSRSGLLSTRRSPTYRVGRGAGPARRVEGGRAGSAPANGRGAVRGHWVPEAQAEALAPPQ